MVATKDQGPIPLSIFDGSCFGTPNKGTKCGEHERNNSHPVDAHGEPQSQDLGAPLPYLWKERAKPLEGRVAAAHIDCCVFLWLCFVVQASLATLVVESLHQSKQNGQLLCTHTTKSAPQTSDVNAGPTPLQSAGVGPVLLCCHKSVFS
jgi:hypothetical protein